MDTTGPSLTHGSERSAEQAPERRALDLVLAALEGHANAALSQALIAIAQQADGPVFDRAHVLDWDESRDELRGWESALEPSRAEGALSATAPRAIAFGAERLSGAAAEAWQGGRSAIGSAGPSETPWRGAAEIGALVLGTSERRAGLLIGEWRTPAGDEARALRFERFAREGAALMRAVERAGLERRRARHAGAVAELARASVSALNLAEALHLVARLAAEATGSRGSAVWRAMPDGTLRLEVTFGIAGERERLARGLHSLALSCVTRGAAMVRDRATEESLIEAEVAAQIRNVAILPVRAYGRELGAIGLYDRSPRGALEPVRYDEVELTALATLGDALALLLDQAGRFDEVRRLELQGRELQARIAREERLATLGELAGRVASEARNPLASIGAFARRVHRELPESTPHREYLEIVIRETERLERLVGSPLESLPGEPLRLEVQNLNDVVQDALRVSGEALVRRRMRLVKKLAPDLPPLLLDAERVKLAITNVLAQALETAPVGGRMRVESRRAGGFAIVELAHDGPRDPGDILEQVFVPFASRADGGGATLGLAMAQQVIHAHGGEIRARAEAEWTSVVSLTLPIQANEDRRRPRGDRRQARPDRRRRGPER